MVNKGYKRKYTWNNFKRKLKEMTDEEKRTFLKDLQAEYMTERTLTKRGLDHSNVRLLRKKIACIKTILHEPGFHYDPRGGKK